MVLLFNGKGAMQSRTHYPQRAATSKLKTCSWRMKEPTLHNYARHHHGIIFRYLLSTSTYQPRHQAMLSPAGCTVFQKTSMQTHTSTTPRSQHQGLHRHVQTTRAKIFMSNTKAMANSSMKTHQPAIRSCRQTGYHRPARRKYP